LWDAHDIGQAFAVLVLRSEHAKESTMIDTRHLGAALDDTEKDFGAAVLVRTHSPGSQALGKGARFRADGDQGGGVRILNLSSPGADWNSGLQVLWADGERVFCREESHTDGDGAGVLTVRPAAEYPSPATLDRLAHEYGLRDELDDAWAARPLQLVREHGRTSAARLAAIPAGESPANRGVQTLL
jgi:hypothetical protein